MHASWCSVRAGKCAEGLAVGAALDRAGDGLEELLVPWQRSDALAVVFAADLDPAAVLATADASVVLFLDFDPGSSTRAPAFAGPLGTDSAWGFLEVGALGWYTLPEPPVASEADLGAYTRLPWDSVDVDVAWLDHAVGGPEADVVVHLHDDTWDEGLYAADGVDVDARHLLAETVPHENELRDWEAGQGPDVLGSGASSLWLRYRADATMRAQVELLHARRP